MCILTNETCTPRSCSYVVCTANKLLSNGRCGKSLRRTTRPLSIDQTTKIEREKIKGKLKDMRDELL